MQNIGEGLQGKFLALVIVVIVFLFYFYLFFIRCDHVCELCQREVGHTYAECVHSGQDGGHSYACYHWFSAFESR